MNNRQKLIFRAYAAEEFFRLIGMFWYADLMKDIAAELQQRESCK